MKNPLDSVVFISLKNSASLSKINLDSFNPDIPLPLRLEVTDSSITEDAVRDIFSAESVLAGILAVFAWDSKNPNKEYYKNLALQLKPNLRTELAGAAIIKMQNGDMDQAEEMFLALKGMNPSDREITLNLALLNDTKARKGDAESHIFKKKAESLYEESINMDPPLPEAFFNAAYFYFWNRDYTRTLEALKTYMTLELGTDETAQTRKKKAKALIQEIENSNMCDSLFNLAYEAINNDQEERALEYINSFIKQSPYAWNAWFLLGWALRRLKRWTDGKNAFLKALELKQKAHAKEGDETEGIADICNEIAICTMEENNLKESRHWLETALKYEPENTKIISNLGFLAWKEGNLEEAESFFLTAAEINPDDEVAMEMLRRFKNSS